AMDRDAVGRLAARLADHANRRVQSEAPDRGQGRFRRRPAVEYEDAGDGFGHERGQYLLSRYEARLDGDTVRVSLRVEEGLMARPERGLEAVVMSDVPGCAHGRDGEAVRVALG
ncbi:MAG: hypothetical protein IH985_10060, partial [Planctomycetes bacterium]|nr:hypothetical protein [Planctomycetota bacterium]